MEYYEDNLFKPCQVQYSIVQQQKSLESLKLQ